MFFTLMVIELVNPTHKVSTFYILVILVVSSLKTGKACVDNFGWCILVTID